MGKDWDKFSPVDLDRGGRWTKNVRGEPGTIDNSDKRTPHGRTGVAFGAARTFTSECQGCGKRDAFRNAHSCAENWKRVAVDDGPPPRMVAFAEWTEAWAREAYRVLKPGGHLLAFAGTRTYHRMVCGVEDAGFEIRDAIAWMYGSGFPKSLDVSKAIDKAAGAEREVVDVVRSPWKVDNAERDRRAYGKFDHDTDDHGYLLNPVTAPATPDAAKWQGWGTALKPAYEPIVVARKPLIGTVAQNVLEHGTGALNINATRIGVTDTDYAQNFSGARGHAENRERASEYGMTAGTKPASGRWPANVALDDTAAAMLDEQSGELHSGALDQAGITAPNKTYGQRPKELTGAYNANSGGASRFFYTAKASRHDRNQGGLADNTHPTVKPTELMRWLIRLVTPPGGIILDPFGGSGSTGVAARAENVRCILIEREDEYLQIIRDRLAQQSLFAD
jgi:site-specific DNA-methyltransferase (adenine-specific)